MVHGGSYGGFELSNKVVNLSSFVFEDGTIGSRQIATKMYRRHDQIAKHIEKYRSELNKKGTIPRRIVKTGGRPVNEYVLSEAQFYHMVLLFENREKTVRLKFQFVKKYSETIDVL